MRNCCWICVLLFFTVFVYSVCFSSSSSSSSEGMSMKDYKAIIKEDSATLPHRLGQRQPLQIPCGLIILANNKASDDSKVYPLGTVVDTSLPTSTISWNAIRVNDNLLSLAVKNNDRLIIPSGSFLLRMGSITATVPCPTLIVTEENTESSSSSTYALRLGMDFLNDYDGIINLRQGDINILFNGESVMIPIIVPRMSFGDDL